MSVAFAGGHVSASSAKRTASLVGTPPQEDALAPFDEPALEILLKFMSKATEASSAALARLIEAEPLPAPSKPLPKRPRVRGSGGSTV